MEDCILVGGSGAVGQSITQALLDDGKKVTVLDEHPPPAGLMAAGAQWLEADLLAGGLPPLPEGEVGLLLGLVARLVDADPPGRWAYALSKLAQERLVAREANAGRLTILRLATICGPGQDCAITRLIRQAVAGHPLRVPRAERSFVPVGDLAG